jgi:two-component system, cell cycle sensor histidine kinase and response regulator CckA
LDLDEVISETSRMLQRLIGEDIQLTIISNPKSSMIEADPGQLTQVIMNLALNARDAMPTGGKLTIETATVFLDKNNNADDFSIIPGSYVRLSVSDTGAGMTEEVREHIFEPFFTTKEIGKGTGLGLATVYGIISQSNGHISVYSKVGVGTTFTIYFPLVQRKEEFNEIESRQATLPLGTETILLVEDEEIVRNLNRQMLEDYGYKVFEATNGYEALSLMDKLDSKIDLLLTDVVMPKMGGRELAEKLTEAHPEIKTLYMSGYTDDSIIRHGISAFSTNFIQKPFTQDTLVFKVREVLEARKN